jgi:hypothetical protein
VKPILARSKDGELPGVVFEVLVKKILAAGGDPPTVTRGD